MERKEEREAEEEAERAAAVGLLAEYSDVYPEVPAEAWEPYRELYPELFSAESWRLPCNCFLVRSGGITILVDTEGTNKIPEDQLEKLVMDHFPLKPRQIIEHLDLRRPIYKETARHGHFGRALPNFTWEKTDMAEKLRAAAGLGKLEKAGAGR